MPQWTIKNALFTKSSSLLSECPTDKLPQFAFIGRSNVGKSSLINMLCGKKDLAKTSAKPGKTQLINHFKIDDRMYFVDLPGYGWAKVSKSEKVKWGTMVNEYLLKADISCLFVLLDIRLELQQIDAEFLIWASENQIPVSIIFTKADKLSKSGIKNAIQGYEKELLKFWEFMPDYFVTSAETREGKAEILAYISQLLKIV